MKDYGHDYTDLKRVMGMGLVVGPLFAVIFLISFHFQPPPKPIPSFFYLAIALLPSTFLGCVVGCTLLFRVRVGDGKIQRLFLGRLVWTEGKIDDIKSLKKAGPRREALVINFKSGKRWRIMMRYRILSELERDLRALRRSLREEQKATSGGVQSDVIRAKN